MYDNMRINRVWIWNNSSNNQPKSFVFSNSREPQERNSGWSLSVNSRRKLMAAGFNSRSIYIWNIENISTNTLSSSNDIQLPVAQIHSAHLHNIPSVAFSSCGNLLLTSSIDCTVKLWNVSSLASIQCLFTVGRPQRVGMQFNWKWKAKFLNRSIHPIEDLLNDANEDDFATGMNVNDNFRNVNEQDEDYSSGDGDHDDEYLSSSSNQDSLETTDSNSSSHNSDRNIQSQSDNDDWETLLEPYCIVYGDEISLWMLKTPETRRRLIVEWESSSDNLDLIANPHPAFQRYATARHNNVERIDLQTHNKLMFWTELQDAETLYGFACADRCGQLSVKLVYSDCDGVIIVTECSLVAYTWDDQAQQGLHIVGLFHTLNKHPTDAKFDRFDVYVTYSDASISCWQLTLEWLKEQCSQQTS